MNMDNQYVTSDLYLTAYLKIKGFVFKVEERKNKFSFIFESTPELLSNVDEYLSEMGNCKPLVYTNAIKNLKNYLHNKK
jgi:hypothetical protein